MHYFGMCCITKDEGDYLREWVAYHALLGVERFIIYDNGSAVPVRETLGRLARPGFVDILTIPGRELQVPAYAHCLQHFGPDFTWLGFIDVDEYLAPTACDDLRTLLADFEAYGGLAVNQVLFGSSGHLARPPLLQIEAYTERLDYAAGSDLTKTILQPRHATKIFGPHNALFREGFFRVNENRDPAPDNASPLSLRTIQLNHYFYRSQQDFCLKVEKGRADTIRPQFRRRYEDFYPQAQQQGIRDESALRFAAPLRRILEESR